MSESVLKRVLRSWRKNPTLPQGIRKKGSGRISLVGPTVLQKMRQHLKRDPTITARQLKALMPDLQHLQIRSIQDICFKRLKLPSRKMASKPILTEQMKAKLVAFANKYQHWTVEEWKKVLFWMKAILSSRRLQAVLENGSNATKY